MSLSIFSLFQVIDQAKALASYPVANLAFAALADAALDREKELHFIWEKSPGNDDDDIYYDLLVISDGLRSACIPAPLLKNPIAFKSLCKWEVDKLDHNRNIDPAILEIKDVKAELALLVKKILSISPNAQALANKYLAKKECQICPFYASGHNEGAIHCSVHPCGYPEKGCQDWEVNLQSAGFEEKREMAKSMVFATVERTGKKRAVFMPREGMKFSDIPWDSHNWTLSGSINDEAFSAVESNGDPKWIWYFVNRQLETIKDGESRWLIGKGCDASSYYEVWVIKDPEAKANPKPKRKPAPDSFWLPLVLDEYEPSDAYAYVATEKEWIGRWGSNKAIPFQNILETCDILQHLPGKRGDSYYDDRWLVWNKKASCFDVLRPAR